VHPGERLDGRPYGTCRVFSGAVVVFTISSILCGLAINAPMLVAARIIECTVLCAAGYK